MFAPDATPLTSLPQWQLLSRHASETDIPLRARLDSEPHRFERLTRRLGELLLDFSNQRIGEDTLSMLLDLAQARQVREGIAAMAAGESINTTEQRAALHIALRAEKGDVFRLGGRDITADVLDARSRMAHFAHALRSGGIRGATGKHINQVVNLGIGGSDLGPRMAAKALAERERALLHPSFVSSPDPHDLNAALACADPEQTLFIISSKSFTTAETLINARTTRHWLQSRLPQGADWRQHFAAVTNQVSAAGAFGVLPERCFTIPDWVGGRFSLWSAIGLPLAAAFGMQPFEEMLRGARSMDRHFLTAPLADNLPVLMALLAIWNVDFLGINNLAVLPYRHALRHLPAYLQQLEMESNGKSVTHAGNPALVPTAPLIWGCAGPLGQHAFHQLFFQGNQSVALDFIVPVDDNDEAHTLMLSQALAQGVSLARGKTVAEAQAELLTRGMNESEAAHLAPHLACPGNVPSSTLLLPGITPYSLGQLLALYEHKVFVQGLIWGINSFDQFGVEYGKTMARSIAEGGNATRSTAGLWAHAQQLMCAQPDRVTEES